MEPVELTGYRRRGNAWYAAILEQLRAADGPLCTKQIWERLDAAGFRHRSKQPKSTLSARLAELVAMKKLDHVGRATYRLREDA